MEPPSDGHTEDEKLVWRAIKWLPLLPRGTALEPASVAIHRDEELTLDQVTETVIDDLRVPRDCRQHVLVYQRVLQWKGFRAFVARGVSKVNNKPDPHWALCVAHDTIAPGQKFLINPLAAAGEVFDLQRFEINSVYSIKEKDFVFTFQVVDFEQVVDELKFFQYEEAAAHAAWCVSSVKGCFELYNGQRLGLVHFLDFCWRYRDQVEPRPDLQIAFSTQLLDVFSEIEDFIKLSNAQLLKKEKRLVGAMLNVSTMDSFCEVFDGTVGVRFRARFKKK